MSVKIRMLIKPNYADQNVFSWRAYPVPDAGEMGLVPNSHAQWLGGDYAKTQSSFASISSGTEFKGEKFKHASAVPCAFY